MFVIRVLESCNEAAKQQLAKLSNGGNIPNSDSSQPLWANEVGKIHDDMCSERTGSSKYT